MIVFNLQDSSNSITGIISSAAITVKAAARITGYNPQYLRRLLRSGKLNGLRVGQSWLILIASLDDYLKLSNESTDRRFGSKSSNASTPVNAARLQTNTPDFREGG